MNIRDFPEDLHKQARLEAVEAGIPLRTLVIEAVRNEVERRRKEREEAKDG